MSADIDRHLAKARAFLDSAISARGYSAGLQFWMTAHFEVRLAWERYHDEVRLARALACEKKARTTAPV